MESDYETFPDDMRLRYNFCTRFLHNAPSFPPFFSHPYTVIAGFLSGKTAIAFADRDKPTMFLHAGEVCVLPANYRRHGRSLTQGGAEFIAAGFLFEVRGGMDFLSFFEVPLRPDKSTAKLLLNLLAELLDLGTDPRGHTHLQINVSRQRIGYAILESILAVSTPKPSLLSMRQLLPAIECFNDNFNARPDLSKFLKMSGFSRTHFFRMFKSQTGTTPIEYVKRRRLREALLLLQESDLNISEIGDKVGWPDPFYFSKIFKAEIGMPPSVYRFQYRNMKYGKPFKASVI